MSISEWVRRVMRSRVAWTVLLAAMAVGAYAGWEARQTIKLPWHDSFAAGDASGWVALGGTWQIADGAMRNDSDERGAKLLGGSPRWKDYTFDADVQLLGKQGDAGLILRSNDEESGVDSYRGYYAGLRGNDDQLVIGRADYGWIQLAAVTMPGGVEAFAWYHLRATIHGCHLSVSAQKVPDGPVQKLAWVEQNCIAAGRVGLRSHSAGGAWKSVVVSPLRGTDLQPAPNVSYTAPSPLPYPPLPMPYAIDEPVTMSHGQLHSARAEGREVAGASTPVESIGGLRLIRTPGRTATVHGAVILTAPRLYVQDATGGVAVEPMAKANLKVGDEVEVSGEVDAHDFSCVLRRAAVRLLWAHSPTPPLAVTATQAATGAFDARFIELEGRLDGQSAGPGNSVVLTLRSGSQSFRAIVNPTRGDAGLRDMPSRAELRIRGVGVVDPQYTQSLTPLVLLVASSDDVEELAGPPWWSLRNLAIFGLITVTVSLLSYLLYLHARHWRLAAIVEERERIAHEMHDTLAQSFVGIGFQLQAISNSVPPGVAGINEQLSLARELVRHSHEEATRSLTTLRREFIEAETLHHALYYFASRLVEHGSISVQPGSNGEDAATPYAVKDALFRIGQEAIANAVRHSRPTILRIQVDYSSSCVAMTIEDNGCGFVYGGELRGFGLTGMRRRAEGIHAEFSVLTAKGKGTRVLVVAPLPPRMTWLTANRMVARYVRRGEAHAGRNHAGSYSYRR